MVMNVYVPHIATIQGVRPETEDTTTLQVVFDDAALSKSFTYRSGQFAELSVFGVGECPISFSSTPTRKGPLEFCVRGVGEVTKALNSLDIGDKIGVRGPYGNGFPVGEMVGKDLLFIGGGIGLAPLRSLIKNVLDNRKRYGKVEIVYGARSSTGLCFKKELELWNDADGVRVHLTIDRAEEGWKGHVGFVPDFLKELNPSPGNRIAVTCGPPVMIELVLDNLGKMGYADEEVLTTLEMKMRCGVGTCGRCNIGDKHVCQDGPVFSLAQLRQLPWRS